MALSLPWCCTGRDKRKNVRLVLPAGKEEPYHPLEEEEIPVSSGAKCGICLALILLLGIVLAVGLFVLRGVGSRFGGATIMAVML